MSIGKRKGASAQGAGATPDSGSNRIGGALSKGDINYIQEVFGIGINPGGGPQVARATGGDISFYGGKVIHVLKSTEDFVVTSPTPIVGETLIVAGAGGAGYYGGGGGAGGLLWYGSSEPWKTANGPAITYAGSTPYTVTIGGGGASLGPYPTQNPKQGLDGTASTITHPSGPYSATGGGGGGGNSPASNPVHDGKPGGSGGGASTQNATGSPGPGIAGQGSAGGASAGTAGSNRAGGGGGAGGVGHSGPDGHGGVGLPWQDFGDMPGPVGYPGPGGDTAGWFAGGGGGSGSGYGEPSPNVTFGGGPGGPYCGAGNGNGPSGPPSQLNGKDNSGSGGGSSSSNGTWTDTTGAGGSGIVIIRYT